MNFRKVLGLRRVIPVVKRVKDLEEIIPLPSVIPIILMGGDISQLSAISELKKQYPEKCLFLHLDLFEGIGKDESGIVFLKNAGVDGIISVKSQLLNYAKQNKMGTVQRLFVVDSEAVKTGLRVFHKITPDAIEILPATVPKYVLDEFRESSSVFLLGGGLLKTHEDVKQALLNGFNAVTASQRNLWRFN